MRLMFTHIVCRSTQDVNLVKIWKQ